MALTQISSGGHLTCGAGLMSTKGMNLEIRINCAV